MKKKTMIVGIILLIIGVAGYFYFKSDTYKIKSGNRMFGKEICSQHKNNSNSNMFNMGDLEHPLVGGAALTKWNCKICKRKDISSTTCTNKLCSKCAEITNRCAICGKLK